MAKITAIFEEARKAVQHLDASELLKQATGNTRCKIRHRKRPDNIRIITDCPPGSEGRIAQLCKYYTAQELFRHATGQIKYQVNAESPFEGELIDLIYEVLILQNNSGITRCQMPNRAKKKLAK